MNRDEQVELVSKCDETSRAKTRSVNIQCYSDRKSCQITVSLRLKDWSFPFLLEVPGLLGTTRLQTLSCAIDDIRGLPLLSGNTAVLPLIRCLYGPMLPIQGSIAMSMLILSELMIFLHKFISPCMFSSNRACWTFRTWLTNPL